VASERLASEEIASIKKLRKEKSRKKNEKTIRTSKGEVPLDSI